MPAEFAAVAMVIATDVVLLLPGVTEGGLNVQRAFNDGDVEQEKVTALLNATPTGSTKKLYVADCPTVMVCVAGLILPISKS